MLFGLNIGAPLRGIHVHSRGQDRDGLAGLANWRYGGTDPDIELIVSLRDDIRLMKQLVRGAITAVGSIEASPGLATMPDPIFAGDRGASRRLCRMVKSPC